jgi:hypothetical protein
MGKRFRTSHSNQLLANQGPNAVNRGRLERVKFVNGKVLPAVGIATEQLQATVRIASVVHAVAATLDGESGALRMQAS